MKPINESRIQLTLKFMEEYCSKHGVCPTYREIKEACGHTSLSLVYSDVERLKERGLVECDSKRIVLISKKESSELRYNYPFMIMTDAFANLKNLAEDEKSLLNAQDNFLKGNYKESRSEAKQLLESSNNPHVIFGARLTLCWCGLFTGDAEPWKDYFRTMLRFEATTESEKMEKELMAHFLTSTLGGGDNCPEWLNDGRLYGLRPEALPLALLLFVANSIKKRPETSQIMLEPICSSMKLNNIDACLVYMDLYLAIAYHFYGDDKYLKSHLSGAIDICVKRGWLTPLAEMKKALGSVLYPMLEEQEEGLVKKVDSLYGVLQEGYGKVYKVLVGDNPARDLSFREVEICHYVRMNLSTKEIADKMYLSPETVKYYLSSVFSKLGVSGRDELKELVNRNAPLR